MTPTPRRRPVSSLLALAVLATVVQRPMHRYEMASIMKARGKGRDMDVKWSSLYTVVGNLEKHGLLEVVGTSRAGARPERTVYRITDAGREEMVDWARELVSTPVAERVSFTAGLSVLAGLAPDDAIAALRDRVRGLEADHARLREETADAARQVPRLFLVEDEYVLAMQQAEMAWATGLLEELESGRHPDVGLWRAWHETGAMPEHLTDVSEWGATD